MKYFIYALLILSLLMAGFNILQVDFENPFSKDSYVAVIATLAALCVITLCLILLTSKKIEKKYKEISK